MATKGFKPFMRQVASLVIVTLLATLLSAVMISTNLPPAQAAEIPAGLGSYTNTLPAGATGPQAAIYKTANVTGKMPTNDWWSSLAFKTYTDHHSERMYPHPLSVIAKNAGLGISYPTNLTITPDG